jgi:type VI secretion system secreted protein Hcp
MFLKMDGVTGESLDEFHPGEIELFGWKWSVDDNTSMEASQSAGADKSAHQDIEITKVIDRASVTLLQYMTLGTPTNATLTLRKKDGDRKIEYLVITLKHVKVSTIQWSGTASAKDADGGGALPEVVTLNFGEYQMNYTPQANLLEQQVAGSIQYKYNVSEKKPA